MEPRKVLFLFYKNVEAATVFCRGFVLRMDLATLFSGAFHGVLHGIEHLLFVPFGLNKAVFMILVQYSRSVDQASYAGWATPNESMPTMTHPSST